MTKIEINGKEYPCRVTMGAMLRFRRETGHDVSRMDSTDMEELVTMLWCCVASACAGEGVDFKMSLIDFADRLDPEAITDFYASMKQDEEAEKKTEDSGAIPASQPTS